MFESENLLSFTGIEDYDSWAGEISAEDLLAQGLKPRRMPRKRGACELLVNQPVVLADGRVNGCACRDVEAELIIGDLQESSLAEICKGKTIAQLLERQEQGDYPDVCKRCTYYVSVYNRRKSILHKNKI
jgi:radical SAM protein with 4Fe4S-binding SPASM domain